MRQRVPDALNLALSSPSRALNIIWWNKGAMRALPPVIIKKVIDAYDAAPQLSVRDIAKIVDLSPASVNRIRKGYQAGLYDRNGFRYEKPLVSV